MSKVLVVNFSNMRPGGIETMLAYLIQHAQSQGMRVIWITSTVLYPQASYRNVVDYDRVEAVVLKPWQMNLLWLPRLPLGEQDDVVMLSTTPLRYIAFDSYRTKYSVRSFRHYLMVPHFQDAQNFPDQYFGWKPLRQAAYGYMTRVARKLDGHDALRAFSMKHLDTYESYYGFPIDRKQEKIMATTRPNMEVTGEQLYAKAAQRSERFEITTCSRFDFPHKGYLLGLLRIYGKLKPEYPQLALTVVGYGPGQKQMEQIIASFPPEVGQSITFTGMLSNDEAVDIFARSHLFVGLAGAAGDAAKAAVPTLVVRHYSETCQTYGFYETAHMKTLCEEEGEDIEGYIRQAMTMHEDAYVANGLRTKALLEDKRNYNPNYIFEQGLQTPFLTAGEIRTAYAINTWRWIRDYAGKIKKKLFR